MACALSFMLCHKLCSMPSLFLFLLILSSMQMRFKAEAGRANIKSSGFSQEMEEDKTLLSAQIGSRPPKCERRCSKCGHCEAIQVPTNPQAKNGKKSASIVAFSVAYARGDDNTNYKPMSWKCKCGKYIFDP